MKKIDARKLPDVELEGRRCQAVKLHKKGMTRAQIGEVVGVHADTVGRWLKAYGKQGAQALTSKRRGRCKGSGRRLNERLSAGSDYRTGLMALADDFKGPLESAAELAEAAAGRGQHGPL